MSDFGINNFSEKVNFLWSIAEIIRDTFNRSDYKDVILPFTVLRRIDCVLEPTKQKVLERYETLQRLQREQKTQLQNMAYHLSSASGYAFYNLSPYDFKRLLEDHTRLAANLQNYINGFSENMREVLDNFGFPNTIAKLNSAKLLYPVMERFKNIDLHPDKVSNHEMGYIFEELIRRYNEALNENPGEHFTPREVIRLMVSLSLALDSRRIKDTEYLTLTISDPCCGSGGMLITAKERILEINGTARIYLYGQEVNPETYAICKSDLYMQSADGRDAEHIALSNCLTGDAHAQMTFDYQFANPPYGKDWKAFQETIEAEYERKEAGRFGAGLPRVSDGQLLFLQHMIGRMKAPEDGGGRVAIVMNGSPLFTGDAESGESEIRRWILENDWLEAIVALPEQIFYNTGITTYVWLLTNRKEERRRGKVQLINAADFRVPARKSLGNKRREISRDHIRQITELYLAFAENEHSRIFSTSDFGYRKIIIERPLRLNFQASAERIARLQDQKAFRDLANGKRKKGQPTLFENGGSAELQAAILAMLATLPDTLYKDRPAFEQALEEAAKRARLTLTPAISKAILSALGERDETAEMCRDKDGNPEPDPELRDTENVPLNEDIWQYFEREVRPHVPDAWINTKVRDHKDGQVGKVGYEINFNRYYYTYQPPRALEEIEADIRALEKDIVELLREVAGC
jgi:type I restriction enzyme M protein